MKGRHDAQQGGQNKTIRYTGWLEYEGNSLCYKR